jgi:hypothetical protein
LSIVWSERGVLHYSCQLLETIDGKQLDAHYGMSGSYIVTILVLLHADSREPAITESAA